MADFPSMPSVQKPNNNNDPSRLIQQQVRPTAIKPAALAATTIVNTKTQILGPSVVANNGVLTIRSIVSNSVNDAIPVGSLPYSLVFFQDALDTAKIIGFGILTGYSIYGPLSLPPFSPTAQTTDGALVSGGSDGQNLVFITQLTNTTGSTQTIYALTNTRFYSVIGGGGTTG